MLDYMELFSVLVGVGIISLVSGSVMMNVIQRRSNAKELEHMEHWKVSCAVANCCANPVRQTIAAFFLWVSLRVTRRKRSTDSYD